MSCGPGAFQTRVLDALAIYAAPGSSLHWTWRIRARSTRTRTTLTENAIAAYECGERVPCWMLRRDLACTRDALSRAADRRVSWSAERPRAVGLQGWLLGDFLSVRADFRRWLAVARQAPIKNAGESWRLDDERTGRLD